MNIISRMALSGITSFLLCGAVFATETAGSEQPATAHAHHKKHHGPRVPRNMRMLHIKNTTGGPLIVSTVCSGEGSPSCLGMHGRLIEGEKGHAALPKECYWFAPVTTGGLKRPGEESQVRTSDALMHAPVTAIEIQMPNKSMQTVQLPEDKIHVHVHVMADGTATLIEREHKAKSQSGKKHSKKAHQAAGIAVGEPAPTE